MKKTDKKTAARKDDVVDPELHAKFEALTLAIEDGSLRKEIEATLDPEWVKKYGDAAWQAAMDIFG
jgi:hypothetical protein